MRILIVSSIRLFGEGVAACLEADAACVTATSCHRSAEVIEMIAAEPPDVVLVDAGQQHGLQQGRALAAARPDIPVIALALDEAASDVIACADAGFASYVPRDAPISRLREIIDMAIRGEVTCTPKISGGLLRELRLRRRQTEEAAPNEPLTRRECDVLRQLTRGLSNKEIARHLSLSEATVKNHVHEVLGKLRVRRRAEAMACVRERPWIANVGKTA